jgi:hypothetical protein
MLLSNMTMKFTRDRIALILFFASATIFAFGYGVAVGKYKVFPYYFLHLAEKGFVEFKTEVLSTGYLRKWIKGPLPWYYKRVAKPNLAPIRNTDEAYQGLNLVTRVAAGRELSAEIIDMDGRKLHSWNIDWFRIWPEPEHLPEIEVPKWKPGTHIHGVIVFENGDLVFNLERKGLVRLDRDSNVVWRLPYQTHHSLHLHDDGNLWVCGRKRHTEPDTRFPHRLPPFYEYTLLEVSPAGKILEEWSVAELLLENSLGGLIYLGSLNNWTTQKRGGDLLHLNDVEPFPTDMEEGFFEQGDILVSLRNINTVFVFSRQSRKIKFICTGWFVRQHDPDFIDGNRFSVFDNNTITREYQGHQSRIMIVSARPQTSQVFFEGVPSAPFYTNIMGKHQWLPNGNLLITESREGRAFEVNRRGKVVWEYVNYVEDSVVGLVDEVQRFPSDYARFLSNE